MTSIYDNLPSLDLWYEGKDKVPESYQVVPCNKRKRPNTLSSVSFSSEPPSVYCYQNNKERPVHRRNSSSEQVKEFLKHYTNKLSRQLSNSSSRSGYRRA